MGQSSVIIAPVSAALNYCKFEPHQVCLTCVAVSHLARGVTFRCTSVRVPLSVDAPFHSHHPEPKKLSRLWSQPAAPGSKWGLIHRKPRKDTEECLAQSTPFTQGLDGEKLSFTQSFTHSFCGRIYTCGFLSVPLRMAAHASLWQTLQTLPQSGHVRLNSTQQHLSLVKSLIPEDFVSPKEAKLFLSRLWGLKYLHQYVMLLNTKA